MGWALVGLGFLDLLLNLNNLVTLVVLHRRTLSVCTLALVTDRFLRSGWDELGVATDVLLSFSLVALMVGGGFLPALGITGLWFWNLCVVLNVMGAGISRMASALRGLREEA